MIIYNGSLPHSGSELLGQILNQNDDIKSTRTDPIFDIIGAVQSIASSLNTFNAIDSDIMNERIKRFIVSGYNAYCDHAMEGHKHLLIKSRGSILYSSLLDNLGLSHKCICMVRDLRGVFNSYEKVYNSNPLRRPEQTRLERINRVFNKSEVSRSLNLLKDSIATGKINDFLVLRYEDLLDDPIATLKGIYKFIGIEPYKHDLDDLGPLEKENDMIFGLYGRHLLRPKLDRDKAKEKHLDDGLSEYIKKDYKWFYELFYKERL